MRRIVPRNAVLAAACCLALVCSTRPSNADTGDVLAETKISDTRGGFAPPLETYDLFGTAVAPLGDLDGNGTPDIAIGAPGDEEDLLPVVLDGGAVWIAFLKPGGAIDRVQKISRRQGNFGGLIFDGDSLGAALSNIGDIDDDGVVDLAVGAPNNDAGTANTGAVWIVTLQSNGTAKGSQEISANGGGFEGTLAMNDFFGTAVAGLGDLDGDGASVVAVAAGAPGDDNGSKEDRGAVWILFLSADGTVVDEQKIDQSEGSFGGNLDPGDFFGRATAGLGDVDGDGIGDLAVGAPFDDDGHLGAGAVWILFLNRDGTVKAESKISDIEGGFAGDLDGNDWFGWSVARLPDLDGNGAPDLAVGAPGDDDGSGAGAVWVLFLERDGTVADHRKLSDTAGDFRGALTGGDGFGTSVAAVGDIGGDATLGLAIGASGDDDGSDDTGAVWIAYLARRCGDAAGEGTLSATDALAVLNASVGAIGCRSCVCDVLGTGTTTTTDALAVLSKAVGIAVDFSCPACSR